MRTSLILLRAIGKAVLNCVGAGVLGDLIVDAVPEIANSVWDEWGKGRDAEERRADVEAVTLATAGEVADEVREIVGEIAAGAPGEVRHVLVTYLHQVPAAIQRTLRRASDPSGKTFPPGLDLSNGDDLIPMLPTHLPRFKPGDHPLQGVDWVLDELLGVGGFGEVWKAHNPHLPGLAPVALKFCIDPLARQRLLMHEAKVIAQVMRQGRHPGIVTLEQTFLRADPPCLQYEYVRGGDLAGLIQEWHRAPTKPGPRNAAKVAHRLAEIIGFAHRLDPPIVHRDLKPSNVLVQRVDGKTSLKVADFGIGGAVTERAIGATRRGPSAGALMTSVVRGSYTPSYASPEQMRGHSPDPRDDVHAIGVIWYQALTGDFGQGRPGGRGWRTRLEALGMSAVLIDLMETCFEDDARDRPADAAVLAEELGRLINPATTVPANAARAGSPSEADQLRFDDFMRLGEDSAGKEQWDQAVTDFSRAILLDPTSAVAYFSRGDAWLSKEEYDKAISDYDAAIRLDPVYADAYNNRGYAWEQKAEKEKAVADYGEAIRLDPESDMAYRNRAQCWYEREEYDKAIADYDEAIRIDPGSVEDFVGRGEAWRAKEEYGKAIADFSEAIRIDPECAAAFHNRGLSWYALGKGHKAIPDFTEAIRLKPDAASAYLFRGLARDAKGKKEEAIADISEAIRIDPDFAVAYRYRGLIFLQAQRNGEAEAEFTEAIRADPDDPDAYLNRAECYERSGDFDKAVSDYSEVLRLDPLDDGAHRKRGDAWYMKGNYERAAADYSEAIRIDPNNSTHYTYRGFAYDNLGELSKAKADEKEAKRLSSKPRARKSPE